MGLVIWNDALTEGVGRSGTRYGLFHERLANETGRPGHWRIEADVATICAVDTVEEAVRRAEGLEGVRCIVRGLARELSEDQLRDAEVTAREMMEAADRALTSAPGAEAQLMRSSRSLRSISEAIRQECTRRQQEESFPPLLN